MQIIHSPSLAQPRVLLLLRLAAAFFVLLAGPALFGEINAPAIPVSEAVPVKAQVKRGGSVEVTLGIYGREDEPVTFRITAQPRHGRLSAMKMISVTQAVVVYQNSGDLNQPGDSFSYEAKTSGGVSAPVAVEIAVTDDPPLFITPDKIDFGEMIAGSSATKDFTIQNQGSGFIDGTLDVDKQWQVAGKQDYHLGPSGSQTFTISFAASAAGEFSGEVGYTGHPERATSLHASVKLPFTVTPQIVNLRSPDGDTLRSGSFDVTNNTDQPEKVLVALPARLLGPAEIDLAPGEKKDVVVKMAPTDVDPIEQQVAFSVPSWKTSLTVRGAVVGPVLRVTPAEIAMGETSVSNDLSTTLTVQNIGGSRAVCSISVSPPFQISLEDASFIVEPGTKKNIAVGFAARDTGDFADTIRLEAPGNDLRIPIHGSVARGPVYKNLPLGVLPDSSGGSPPVPAAPGLGVVPKEKVSAIPAIKTLFIRRLGSTSCEVVWKAPADGNLRYQVETRELSMDAQKKLVINWLAIMNLTVKSSGGELWASLTGLNPHYPYAIRIRSIDSKGELSAPSRVINFLTKQKWRPKISLPEVLFAALAIMVGLIIRDRFSFSSRE